MFKNKNFTDQREFNQNMCRGFLKDKIKILKSFCSNLIKIRAVLFVLNNENGCLRHLTGFTFTGLSRYNVTWALYYQF